MALSSNGVIPGNGTPRPATVTARCPRRLVLLADGEDSAVIEVLAEYHNGDVSGNRLHAELQRRAAEHPGRTVAAEWQGKLGWTRFLWCRK
jgi:hypothetical protein